MTNRFSDIDHSFKRLPPVYGFQSEKLVTIEKSLELFQQEIDQLDRYIKLAKKHCHYPSEHGLSRDESAAIYIYTMEWGETSLYRYLNKALRSEDRQTLKIWFPYLKLFDCALEKLPTTKEILWRGVSLDIGKNFVKNQLITWWTINSCSSSVDVIKKFIQNDKNATLFLIEAKNGKRISDYTQYENEDEIILPIGSQFCVKSNVLEQNSSHIVHLIEIDENDDDDDHSVISTNKQFKSNKLPLPKEESICSNCISMNTRWKQDAITLIERNDRDNELFGPHGIYIDDDNQSIYVADSYNHRILQWKYNQNKTRIVAGGNGQGDRIDQLKSPTDLVLDKTNDSLIICDSGNSRVVRWSPQNNRAGEIIISNISCWGITMDNNKYIYISEANNQVTRWKIGDTKGTVVAGGNGLGDHLNQLNYPTYICIDQDYSVYVSDSSNHRVMKWSKGAKEGIILAGGQGKGNDLNQLSNPMGVTVDHLGNVYVADNSNYRIMRRLKQSQEGDILVGGNGYGQKANQLNNLRGLSFDRQGNLYVVDCGNNRIQKFDIDSR